MDKHFKELFAGNKERFLTYDPHSTSKRDDGKTKVNYRTVNQPVDDDDWAAHLSGKRPLGLSPLRNGMVKWGAVDVDYYRDDGPFFQSEEEVTAFLKAWGDPCLIANTKSRGFPTMHPILDKQVKGTDLGSLPDFRATMAKLTGSTYPDGEHWKAFVPPQADWSPGDPEDVERAFADQQRQKFGDEPPF